MRTTFRMGKGGSLCFYVIDGQGDAAVALITLDNGRTLRANAAAWERFLAKHGFHIPRLHLDANSRGTLYWRMRVEGRQKMLARLLYPDLALPRHDLRYRDGNPSNLTLANLRPLSREQAAAAAAGTKAKG